MKIRSQKRLQRRSRKRSQRHSKRRSRRRLIPSIKKIISIGKSCYETNPCKHDITVQYGNKNIEKITMYLPDIVKLAKKLNYTNLIH
jgi:hypothetical protein